MAKNENLTEELSDDENEVLIESDEDSMCTERGKGKTCQHFIRFKMDASKKIERLPHPRRDANIIEILSFSWLLNLFKTGRKRDLEINDIYATLDDHMATPLGSKLEENWKTELGKPNKNPSLLRVLIQMFGAKFMLHGIVIAFSEVFLKLSQPLLIGGLLMYFNQEMSNKTSLTRAYVCAFGLSMNMLASAVLFYPTIVELYSCGMMTRISCSSVIFKKALRLSKTTLDKKTVGQIVNLVSNDANRFDTASGYLHFLWISPLQSLVATYFMWQEVGLSSVFGLAACFMFIPLQVWLGKKTSEFRSKTATLTDERVRLMHEIISGVHVIKMYTWEKCFTYLIQQARMNEIRQIKGSSYIRTILSSFAAFHTKISLFVCVISYVLLGNVISVKKIFVIASYYSILQMNICVRFPKSIGLLAEVLVTVKRIQNFLSFEEKNNHTGNCSKNKDCRALISTIEQKNNNNIALASNNNTYVCNQNAMVNSFNLGIVISKATAKWPEARSENCLDIKNLTVGPGQLTAVVGPVGAGKSTLIQAILRELPLSEGFISVQGVVSYASQEPWLFAGSVQQNILFGSPMDEERYRTVVSVCALKTDLKQLPYGDRTLVGDRGVALSGGQKSRINLARSVYKQADIYLFDDPLSAVDTHVAKHLFDNCIKDYLKDKTRVIITHQIQLLTSADQIVLMDGGTIKSNGTYAELRDINLDFATLFGSPEKTIMSDTEYFSNNNIGNDVCQRTVFDRKGSIQSDESSIDCRNVSESQTAPVDTVENRSFGNTSHTVYFKYVSAGGRFCKILFFIFICILTQLMGCADDLWITYWVNLEEGVFRYIASADNSLKTILGWKISRQICIYVFAGLTLTIIVTAAIRSITFVSFCMRASLNLHNNMFNSIIRATMQFFNTNSSGRILNRFSMDIGYVDEKLPESLMDAVHIGLSIVGIITVITFVNIYLLIPTCIMSVIFYKLSIFYLSTSRSIKRLDGITRSPMYAHISATLQGLLTIRAFKVEQILAKEYDGHQDLHSSVRYLIVSTTRAFIFWADIVVIIYITIVTFSFLLINRDTFGGNVGLVITQALGLIGWLQSGTKKFMDLENNMTAVERVLEYSNVPQEGALESPPNKKSLKQWPSNGRIIFINFNLKYGLYTPDVIKNLDLKIDPMQKIGIVGRTGAGKSSLIAALFRLAFHEGTIIIDDIEIHGIGLHELRSKISIIPQEPVLFSGTIRTNLDPFSNYPDHVLWDALDEVELKSIIAELPLGLDSRMAEGGSNFSVGQKQLVCLARAIIRNNKIVILDEATANVDLKTDALIQRTIRNKFKTSTVLTIAHRLNTVMDSDKVLVMDAGQMVEFDHPHNLLQNKNGFLYKMVEQTGRDMVDSLQSIAEQSYRSITTREPEMH